MYVSIVYLCIYRYVYIFTQIPASWLKVWDGPGEPPQYIRLLVAKTLALSSWEEKAITGQLLDKTTLDLSELFHPDTFLNALRQQTARYSRLVTIIVSVSVAYIYSYMCLYVALCLSEYTCCFARLLYC